MNRTEAMEQALKSALTYIKEGECNIHFLDECKKIENKIKSALTIPRRNCDVGTAEEQGRRFLDYCLLSAKTEAATCDGCPLNTNGRPLCETHFGQMPYEESEDKDEQK